MAVSGDKILISEKAAPGRVGLILGLLLIVVMASVGLLDKDAVGVIKTLYKWAFAMAFFSIGLELSFKEIGKMGWPPVIVYLAATVFNTLLALGVAWVIFGVLGS